MQSIFGSPGQAAEAAKQCLESKRNDRDSEAMLAIQKDNRNCEVILVIQKE